MIYLILRMIKAFKDEIGILLEKEKRRKQRWYCNGSPSTICWRKLKLNPTFKISYMGFNSCSLSAEVRFKKKEGKRKKKKKRKKTS